MSQPIRVAYLIDTLSWGGAQKLVLTFAEAVRTDRRIVLTVVSLQQQSDSLLPDELRALDTRVVVFPFHKVSNPISAYRLTRFLQRERFDVVHAHLTHAAILGSLAGRLSNTPIVVSLHAPNVEPRYYHPLRYRLETFALRYGPHRLIAVGHTVAEAQSKRLKGRAIEVIPNAVAPATCISSEERTALRAEVTGDPSRPLLIAVGRLTPPKGYGDLLTAFAALRETHPEAVLAIAGDGELHDELVAQIAALKLEGQALLLGIRNDVPRLLAASDIFVSSSHWEGLSVAVLEGMAAGLPLVVTSAGDVPRVVVNGTGIIVPPKDPARLAEALRLLLDDPAQRVRLGTAARDHVLRNYSPNVWLEQLLALYEQLHSTKHL